MAANDAVSMNVAENRQNVPMAIQENRAAVPMTVAEGGGTPGGLNKKADKVTGAAAGNLAGLDSTGNLTDSGKAPGDFLEAPAAAGSEGQVLTADGEGGASWQDPTGGDPTEIIDDTAGSGDTDKVWSADKSHELLTQINSKADEPTGTKSAGKVYGLDSNLNPAWVDGGGGSVDPQDIEDAVDAWLDENITNPDSPPLDRSLSSSSSAAPADMVGDMESLKEHTLLSGTYSGTQYLKVEKTFAPGKYHITITNITSSDTQDTTCRFGFNSGNTELLYTQFNRGVAIDVEMVLESEATSIWLYAASIYAYGSGDTFSFNGLKITKSYDLRDEINNIKQNLPIFDSFQIKTKKVFDSFTPNVRSYNFSTGATINNYDNYAVSSSISYNTPPIQIRNKDGTLIYNNLHTITKTADTNAAWTFDINGNYLRTVTYSQMSARSTPFLSDEYYVILNEYPVVSDYADIHWYVSSIDIGWLNGKSEYIVGSGGDFTTFTDMLVALEDDASEKIVYVKGGTYDIFTEMGGAEYIASIAPSASELGWRDVCHVVPPNTKIIGLGNVVLSWQPTAQQMVNETTSFLFSPLNLSGTCHIENISVVAKNCRYAVHDETSQLAKYDGAKHYFKNCRFTLLEGSYGFIVYGAGHNRLMDVRFDDCVIESQNSSLIWSTHDQTTAKDDNSVFVFNNCVFTSTKSDPNLRFSSTDSVGRLDKVMFNNCYLQKIKFVTTSGSNAKQGYDIQLIGCSPVNVEYEEHVTDRVAVRQYNPIPQTGA